MKTIDELIGMKDYGLDYVIQETFDVYLGEARGEIEPSAEGRDRIAAVKETGLQSVYDMGLISTLARNQLLADPLAGPAWIGANPQDRIKDML